MMMMRSVDDNGAKKTTTTKTVSLTFRRKISDFKGLKEEKSVSDVRLGWLVPSGFSLAVKEEVDCERGLKHALAT